MYWAFFINKMLIVDCNNQTTLLLHQNTNMKHLLIAAHILLFAATLGAQTNTLPVFSAQKLNSIISQAVKVELVTLHEQSGTITVEDSVSVKAMSSYIQPQMPAGDKSCLSFCKMFVYSADSLLLDGTIHYFNASRCCFIVINENNIPTYIAALDLGGEALCQQMMGYNGYPPVQKEK